MHKKIESSLSCFSLQDSRWRPFSALGLLMALLLGSGSAVPPSNDRFDRMETHTVRVFCATEEGVGTGTGFVIGQGAYVATNHHVIGCLEAGGEARVGLGPEDFVGFEVVWSSSEKDLAVLKLERNIDRPPVTFIAERYVARGDNVEAMGFPGAADRSLAGAFDPSLTRGIISRLVEDDNGWKLYQIDAAINPGNSGGPLFNQCVQVVGINVQKSLTMVRDANGELVRVPEGEGIGWAIRADELMAALDRLDISYEQASTACTIGATFDEGRRDPLVIGGLALALLLALAAVGLSVTARGRAAVQHTLHTLNRSSRATQPKPPVAKTRPILRGISGPYAHTTLELGEDPLSIGRDPRISQLVFPPTANRVSKRHCTLAFDPASRQFILEDCWSTNGTFLASGTALKPGEPHLLKAGDRFYLGEKEHLFEVQYGE